MASAETVASPDPTVEGEVIALLPVPATSVAVLPSLRVSVGVPVTATVLPGNSLPFPGEAITCVTVTEGVVVSICGLPWVMPVSGHAGRVACTIDHGRAVEVEGRDHQVGRVLSRLDGIGKGQGIAAGAAGVGCKAAIVEG